jgi:hypothetical protein
METFNVNTITGMRQVKGHVVGSIGIHRTIKNVTVEGIELSKERVWALTALPCGFQIAKLYDPLKIVFEKAALINKIAPWGEIKDRSDAGKVDKERLFHILKGDLV